jgi:hypothetical protein
MPDLVSVRLGSFRFKNLELYFSLFHTDFVVVYFFYAFLLVKTPLMHALKL